jgi:hypothetical protein
MIGIVVTENEVLEEMRRLYPNETRVAVLTVTNRKLVDKGNELERIVTGQRAEANEDAWKRDSK